MAIVLYGVDSISPALLQAEAGRVRTDWQTGYIIRLISAFIVVTSFGMIKTTSVSICPVKH